MHIGYKIPISPFPVIFFGIFVVGFCGIYCCFKSLIQNVLPIYFKLCQPWGFPDSAIIETHAPESRFIVLSKSCVHLILRVRACSNVFSSVVQSISVFMVYLMCREIKNNPVHKNPLLFPVTITTSDVCHRVPCVAGFNSVPFKFFNRPLVHVVNYCRLPMSEWNYNHAVNIP